MTQLVKGNKSRHSPQMDKISEKQIEDFHRDGVMILRGAFTDWVDVIAAGIERNMTDPSKFGSENAVTKGRFFDDYCNWRRIAEFEDVVRNSDAAGIARQVMRSDTAHFYHDHVLVKEPGTPKETPWHQDGPYYFVEGEQTVSMWVPVDPVRENSLRFIAGSHQWDGMVRPVSWSDNSDYYEGDKDWIPVPDPDANPGDMQVLEWPMQPGDAVLFDYRTVHGARGNTGGTRRRAFSMRWFGDDARYVERGARTSPPFTGHGMQPGQTLREDWFPII